MKLAKIKVKQECQSFIDGETVDLENMILFGFYDLGGDDTGATVFTRGAGYVNLTNIENFEVIEEMGDNPLERCKPLHDADEKTTVSERVGEMEKTVITEKIKIVKMSDFFEQEIDLIKFK